MSIINIKSITTYDKMRVVSTEYKLWGIPLVKHTYEQKYIGHSTSGSTTSEGVPLYIQESLQHNPKGISII